MTSAATMKPGHWVSVEIAEGEGLQFRVVGHHDCGLQRLADMLALGLGALCERGADAGPASEWVKAGAERVRSGQ